MKIRLIKAKPHEQQLWDSEVAHCLTGNEGIDRLMIQEWISKNDFRPVVMYDGNSVIRKDKIITEFKRLLQQGSLSRMSDYFYCFLSLDAGSIAHFNKQGWISTYNNSVECLCKFFLHNEFGRDVVSEQPGWKTDCIAIGKEILAIIQMYRGEPGGFDESNWHATIRANSSRVVSEQFG